MGSRKCCKVSPRPAACDNSNTLSGFPCLLVFPLFNEKMAFPRQLIASHPRSIALRKPHPLGNIVGRDLGRQRHEDRISVDTYRSIGFSNRACNLDPSCRGRAFWLTPSSVSYQTSANHLDIAASNLLQAKCRSLHRRAHLFLVMQARIANNVRAQTHGSGV